MTKALPALLLSLVTTLAHGDEARAPVSVPFELITTQHIVVQVKVNGKGPYRLILDTGAPDSLVSNRVAREARLRPVQEAQPALPIFGARGQFRIDSLEIGGLKAEDLSAMVLDHPAVTAISGIAGPVEGILGFTFFARYRMTIDYERKRLSFEPTAYRPGDVMQDMIKRVLAGSQTRTPRVLAPGSLLGVRIKAADKEEAGVLVAEVLAEGAAAAAGMQPGDRLLSLAQRWTDSVADLFVAAGQLRPGVPVDAVVVRQGKELVLKLTPRSGL